MGCGPSTCSDNSENSDPNTDKSAAHGKTTQSAAHGKTTQSASVNKESEVITLNESRQMFQQYIDENTKY
jgi:hypothetical protein